MKFQSGQVWKNITILQSACFEGAEKPILAAQIERIWDEDQAFCCLVWNGLVNNFFLLRLCQWL